MTPTSGVIGSAQRFGVQQVPSQDPVMRDKYHLSPAVLRAICLQARYQHRISTLGPWPWLPFPPAGRSLRTPNMAAPEDCVIVEGPVRYKRFGPEISVWNLRDGMNCDILAVAVVCNSCSRLRTKDGGPH